MANHAKPQPRHASTLDQPAARVPVLAIADMLADPVTPADFPQAILRWRNDRAAADVGLADLDDAAWIGHFARFRPIADNLPQPLALRYHGHQFGVYNPDLGDGRGFLFAQLRSADGRWRDLGTKGSGTTPYSRAGDGRLTLKGAVRELLATEMLAALGVHTSATFSIIETGEALHRGDEPSPTRSAVMVRLTHGHIRIGSFQRLAAIGDEAGLERLVRYALGVLHGADDADALDREAAAARLLRGVVARAADLAASYLVAGFVHGVLNTDNINVTGESFDYGPWRFAPRWDGSFVAAYFDHAGRYAFGRQPEAIHWATAQLAIALRPLCRPEPLVAALEAYAPAFERALARRMAWRAGRTMPGDQAAFVAAMQDALRLCAPEGGLSGIDRLFAAVRAGSPATVLPDGPALETLKAQLGATTPVPGATTPLPLTGMLIDEVEAIWSAIDTDDDWAPLSAKVRAVRAMGTAMGPPPAPSPLPAA